MAKALSWGKVRVGFGCAWLLMVTYIPLGIKLNQGVGYLYGHLWSLIWLLIWSLVAMGPY